LLEVDIEFEGGTEYSESERHQNWTTGKLIEKISRGLVVAEN
jgi:hypothetical protein